MQAAVPLGDLHPITRTSYSRGELHPDSDIAAAINCTGQRPMGAHFGDHPAGPPGTYYYTR
jgi:hypothetical protein